MGEIAHLASEYPLSYDMFERSADMFLQSGDSIAYFYALNDMAYELAEQGKKEETLQQLRKIESRCTEDGILRKVLETKAEMYLKCHQYDSVLIFLRNQNTFHLTTNPTVLLIVAQTFSYLEIKDSAVYYANLVLSLSNDIYNTNNALYILTNDDTSKDISSVRETAADRSDTQKLIEIRQGKLSQAVQLLEQDLHRKPNLAWLYAIMLTLIFVGIFVAVYVHRKRRKQQLLTQQIGVLQDTLVERNSQLKEQQDNILKRIQGNCEWFVKSKEIRILLQKEDYTKVCELINIHFSMLADKLKNIGRLNEKDVCLCIFVMDGTLTDKQIADILYYSHKTIRSIKRYVAKKIGTTSANLQTFLLDKAIE